MLIMDTFTEEAAPLVGWHGYLGVEIAIRYSYLFVPNSFS